MSHSRLDNGELVDVASYSGSESGTISCGNIETGSFLSQPHQILCASGGRVVCTNTGRNSIVAIDLHRPGQFHEFRLSAQRWDRLERSNASGDHLNSLFERNGSLFVLTHRHRQGSFVAELSYPEMELRSSYATTGRTGLRNLWITHDGRHVSCHSDAGTIVDLRTESVLWDSGTPAYTRGIAATRDLILVGETQISGRDDRRRSQSGLWVLDRHRWEAIDYLPLGPFGAVHEVHLLDEAGEAHHGLTFAGVDALRQHDARRAVTSDRLASAATARNLLESWAGYATVLGRAVPDANGRRRVAPEELAIAIERHPSHHESIGC